MPDPISVILIAGAAGGAAGKFVEKAWDSGERWISTYFRDHHPTAMEAAHANTAEFLKELADRIDLLEKKGEVPRERIESAQEHPDFSAALHRAMIAAAQTDDKEKRKLLARLISDRLGAEPESLLALAQKMACDAIANTNSRQMKILAFLAEVFFIAPTTPMDATGFSRWLSARLPRLLPDEVRQLDLWHLESVSCLRTNLIMTRDLSTMMAGRNKNIFDKPGFEASELGKRTLALWKQNLSGVTVTSIGQIIGVYACDQLLGQTTHFVDWG